MRLIERSKNNIFKDFHYQENLSYRVGLRIFQLGVLFLAAAPAIAFILLIFASLLGGLNKEINYLKDRYNYPFLIVSILMILNCTFITQSNNSYPYPYDTSNMWIGLSNWIPFFWCFWGFQPFLRNTRLRIQTSKFFIIGSLPVILSGFSQYFLKLYGPFRFFNNLIVWYQRPLTEDSGVTGLFNNQNYAGAWLSIILPFCLVFLINKGGSKIRKVSLFLICSSFIYMIFLTSSRIAIISVFIIIFLFSKSLKKKLLILISFFSLPLILNLIPFASLKLQTLIYDFLPYELIKKTSLINSPNLNLFPRVEVWNKSIELIKSNPITGYGAGSFKSLYELSNGIYGDMQHSHNIFLEIAINHGLLCSFIILIMMMFLIIYNLKNFSQNYSEKNNTINPQFNSFNKAWIFSFIVFFLIHIFDITYFDGRISTTAWILLAGLRSMILESTEAKKT